MKRETRRKSSGGLPLVVDVVADLSVRASDPAVHAETTAFLDIAHSWLALEKGEPLLHP